MRVIIRHNTGSEGEVIIELRASVESCEKAPGDILRVPFLEETVEDALLEYLRFKRRTTRVVRERKDP